jgi:serine/threonine protein kinase
MHSNAAPPLETGLIGAAGLPEASTAKAAQS